MSLKDAPYRPPPFVVGDAVEARLRGKHHWYPATVVRVDVEGAEDHQWRFSISYTVKSGHTHADLTTIQ
jgi:hypothetical protein